ncbi:hypothetical protein ENBRE01_0829 [Enteropsectra breve]|nr:hypothetical protein ENBRE01_0829 [Enteropsectra breve]
MPKFCQKCNAPAHIKIKNLPYCNSCFIAGFETRIKKNLSKLYPEETALLYISSTELQELECFLLDKILAERKFSKITVLCESKNIDLKILHESMQLDSANVNLASMSLTDIKKYAEAQEYTALIYTETMESIAASVVECFCSGTGKKAQEYLKPCEEIKHRNMLNDISDKETAYYIYLNKISRSSHRSHESKAKGAIRSFLTDISEKNSLALYNILGIFKKL